MVFCRVSEEVYSLLFEYNTTQCNLFSENNAKDSEEEYMSQALLHRLGEATLTISYDSPTIQLLSHRKPSIAIKATEAQRQRRSS